ncbi:hypothetical protein [Burkholderia cenocepacia]|uniref:hypothetical protein n=1 Tax=Burkholderia cenocepacia TaxID=95486 RepID=UPI000F5AA24A|nr:hypothetical protein [Burkholderia cenocepacia]
MTKRLIRCRTRDGGISIGDGARGAKRTSAADTDINEIHRRVWGDLAPTNDKHSAEPWPR